MTPTDEALQRGDIAIYRRRGERGERFIAELVGTSFQGVGINSTEALRRLNAATWQAHWKAEDARRTPRERLIGKIINGGVMAAMTACAFVVCWYILGVPR